MSLKTRERLFQYICFYTKSVLNVWMIFLEYSNPAGIWVYFCWGPYVILVHGGTSTPIGLVSQIPHSMALSILLYGTPDFQDKSFNGVFVWDLMVFYMGFNWLCPVISLDTQFSNTPLWLSIFHVYHPRIHQVFFCPSLRTLLAND